MNALVLLGTFVILVAFGVPIGFCTGLSALASLLYAGTPITACTQRMFATADSFTYLAIPFFMLAGKLMEYGGISKKMIKLAETLIGYIAGGLGVVSTLSCIFFGAVSGSSVGTVSAIGSIMLPSMEENGYDKGFASALISTSGSLGLLIPPSIGMVIYAVSQNVSVADLFTCGIEVGLIAGLAIIIYTFIKSKKCGYKGSGNRPTLKEVWFAFKDAFLALLMPLIILGGIYGGFFTPTEASAVACLYAFIIGKFVYKQFDMKGFFEILMISGKSTAQVMFIICTSALFGWQLTLLQVPQMLAAGILSLTTNRIIIITLMLLFLVVIGMLMEGNAYLIILAPILAPVAVSCGIDLVQFGLIMETSICVGCITPPMGINMFTTCGIYPVKYEEISKNIWPFVLIMTGVLFLVAFVPAASNLFLR
ncbi:MAG: TRAP transporter large permease [Clostridia bacterium]|nr:TRAP transporter large permease [Clostridia bacterium]